VEYVAAEMRALGTEVQLATSGHPGIVRGGLDFDGSAAGYLGKGLFLTWASLILVLGEESAIRITSAAILQRQDAADPGLERLADMIEKRF
jgi:hypothetical protein